MEQPPSVAVVIPCYNHAHFLGDALASVMAQSHAVDEIVVVDDGSVDHPQAVVARFPPARLVRTENQGLSAARNTGLHAVTSDFVLFLDADDILYPDAIAASLACIAANPAVGFVYGAHCRLDAGLEITSGPHFKPAGPSGGLAFLRGNLVGVPAAAMYDRAKLVEGGGFDRALPRCEDYDSYLRLAMRYPLAGHGVLVAGYRQHGANMSADPDEMLAWALFVHRRYQPPASDAEGTRAWRKGARHWRDYYANAVWRRRNGGAAGRRWRQRLRAARLAPFSCLMAALRRLAREVVPAPALARLRRALLRNP